MEQLTPDSYPDRTNEEIERRFGFHPATETTRPLHEEIRAQFILMGEFLIAITPKSAEQAHALKALQEASMWANAAVATNLAPLEN